MGKRADHHEPRSGPARKREAAEAAEAADTAPRKAKRKAEQQAWARREADYQRILASNPEGNNRNKGNAPQNRASRFKSDNERKIALKGRRGRP